MWTKETIEKHIDASRLLEQIKNRILIFIKNNPNTNEKNISDFILEQFKKNNLKSDKDPPIVAFNLNTDRPHYNPSLEPKNLEDNTLILLDIWANLKIPKSPFADMTWMAYKGESIPEEIKNVFNIVIAARDKCLDFLKEELKKGKIPTGKQVDDIARNFIKESGFEGKFLHTTGHSLGNSYVHGIYKGISQRNPSPLVKNLGYTIEPGIYLQDKFGIRSELDFYINDNLELIITTPIQKEIDLI